MPPVHGHCLPVRQIVFDPAGKTITSIDAQKLYAWDARSGRPLRRLNLELPALARIQCYGSGLIRLAPDGQTITSIEEKTLTMRDIGSVFSSMLVIVCQRAQKEIMDLGDEAIPELNRALANKPSLEVRRRIEEIVSARIPPMDGGRLRLSRVLVALEGMRHSEADKLLQIIVEKNESRPLLAAKARAALARRRSGP